MDANVGSLYVLWQVAEVAFINQKSVYSEAQPNVIVKGEEDAPAAKCGCKSGICEPVFHWSPHSCWGAEAVQDEST
jgi:hypothetical protein